MPDKVPDEQAQPDKGCTADRFLPVGGTGPASEIGAAFGAGARTAAALAKYLRLLEKWSAVHNLTGARNRAALAGLVKDCAPLVRAVGPRTASAADLGSGAGMPGLVLALVRPDIDVNLIESRGSKAAFLRHAAAELGAGNVTVACCRIERWRPGRTLELLCARAVARLATLASAAAHLGAAGTLLLALKARCPAHECAALEKADPRWKVLGCSPTGSAPSRYLVRAVRES